MLLTQLSLIFIIYANYGTSDVIQMPPILIAEQGHTAAMSCEYTDSSFYSLQWFKQIQGKGLISLTILRTEKNVTEDRYVFTLNKDKKLSNMFIMKLEGEDSAVYWCGHATGGLNKLIFGSGTPLTVQPKTEREIPSVYKLQADKADGLPSTVCLVTDFPTPNTTLTVDGQEITLTDKSALDNSSSDVWRYGAVVWDNDNPSKDLPCKVTYDGKAVPQEEKIIDETATICSSLTINERFRTNPGMNTLSLSVLGLRMLTAKAVIFQLLLTLRLLPS